MTLMGIKLSFGSRRQRSLKGLLPDYAIGFGYRSVIQAMFAVVLGGLVAFGQQSPTPAPNPEKSGAVFSVTSTLVQVDAVVTDGKGRNIADLAPDEFQVLIDGKPQPLTNFSYVQLSTAAPAHAAKSGPVLPPPS